MVLPPEPSANDYTYLLNVFQQQKCQIQWNLCERVYTVYSEQMKETSREDDEDNRT